MRHVDRYSAALCRAGPCSFKELVRRAHELIHAGADPLRLHENDTRLRRKHIHEADHLPHEKRGQGLHALNGDSLCEATEKIGRSGKLLDRGAGPLAYLVRQENFPARGRVNELKSLLQRALIRDRKVADLLELITKEVEANGMRKSRWEHIYNPAAHSKLATRGHHIHARIRCAHELFHELIDLDKLAAFKMHGCELLEAPRHGLHERAHGHHEDLHTTRFLWVRERIQS